MSRQGARCATSQKSRYLSCEPYDPVGGGGEGLVEALFLFKGAFVIQYVLNNSLFSKGFNINAPSKEARPILS